MKYVTILFAVLVYFLAVPTNANANINAEESTLNVESALDNLAYEYAMCSAYTFVISVVLENSSNGQPEDISIINQYKDLSDDFAALSAKISGWDATITRFKMAIDIMKEDIKEVPVNSRLPILVNKYGIFCRDLYDNPDASLEYYLNKQ